MIWTPFASVRPLRGWVGLSVQMLVCGDPLNIQTPPICSNSFVPKGSLLPCCNGGGVITWLISCPSSLGSCETATSRRGEEAEVALVCPEPLSELVRHGGGVMSSRLGTVTALSSLVWPLNFTERTVELRTWGPLLLSCTQSWVGFFFFSELNVCPALLYQIHLTPSHPIFIFIAYSSNPRTQFLDRLWLFIFLQQPQCLPFLYNILCVFVYFFPSLLFKLPCRIGV